MKNDDAVIEAAIRAKAEKAGDGFWKIYHMLRQDGYVWNHKRVYRVYKAMKFNKRTKSRRRLPARVKKPIVAPEAANITWSMDFVSDTLKSNRKFRVLNVIDDHNRYAVGQKAAYSIPSTSLIQFLDDIIWEYGKPQNIRCDNGPEFISSTLQDWAKANDINIIYTQPGCPTQNSYIERFNGSYRRAVLDTCIFRTLADVKEKTEEWRNYYNKERPHEALGNEVPEKYQLQKAG